MIGTGHTTSKVYLGSTEAKVYLGSTQVYGPAGGVTPEIPNEYEFVTAGMATATLPGAGTGVTSASGHNVVGNYGADPEAAVKIKDSSIDGTRVATVEDSGSDAHSVYMYPTGGLEGPCVYYRCEYRRVGSSTTDTHSTGGMAWDQVTNNATAKAAPHQVLGSAAILDTTYDSGSQTTIGTFAQSDTGTAWRTYEFAINKATGALVERGWLGDTNKFTSAAVSSVDGRHPTFEWFNLAPQTNKLVECRAVYASSLSAMTDAHLAYYNDLLAEEGESPVTLPAVQLIGYGSIRTNTISLGPHSAGDLIVAVGFRVGSNTAPTLPAGWTQVSTSPGVGNSAAMRVATKVAASSSETFGTWTNATAVAYVVLRGASTVNPSTFSNGSSSTITYPALTLFDTSGDSRIIRFGGHDNADQATSTPAGYTVLTKAMQTFGGGVLVLMDTSDGVGTNPASAGQTVNGSSGWQSVTIEAIPT